VLNGETPDVFIGSTLSMPVLEKARRIRSGSAVTLCKVAIAMVVPTGTPKPPLASVDDFKRAVMGAKVLVYADPARGGAAGVHVGRTLEKLGLARELRMPVVLAAGGDITEVTLAQGVGAVGITQASEIVGKPGAEYVGALPPALQNYTVFVAAVPADAPASSAASAFMAFLRSPAVIAVIRAKGMDVD
jgi:molybdate transport system substrate-binding protein